MVAGRKMRIALALSAGALASPVSAGVLEVTPILTDVVTDSSGASSITIRNRAASPATVQLRLLRWHLVDGEDRTEPTTVAAVSPPFITIQPGAVHVVRLVRTSQQAIVGEEAYRLLLDELPAPNSGNIAVSLAVRHALPVFFRSSKARSASVHWSIVDTGSVREVAATNEGDRRLRIARLRVEDATGHVIDLGEGLAGYSLGRSERRWRLPADRAFDTAHATVRFVSEAGAEMATAPLNARARP
jgi:fimbrial chaperone protein